MEASIVDLRYKTKEVLLALERNEEVHIRYRGKLKGRILPARQSTHPVQMSQHPFFGSAKDGIPVEEVINALREKRCR